MKLEGRLVLTLLVLQAVVTVFLYTLNPTGKSGQATFATFLGIDLLTFAMVSYIYRTGRSRRPIRRGWLLSACILLLVLLASSLFTA